MCGVPTTEPNFEADSQRMNEEKILLEIQTTRREALRCVALRAFYESSLAHVIDGDVLVALALGELTEGGQLSLSFMLMNFIIFLLGFVLFGNNIGG